MIISHQRIKSDAYNLKYELNFCVTYPRSAGAVAINFALVVSKADAIDVADLPFEVAIVVLLHRDHRAVVGVVPVVINFLDTVDAAVAVSLVATPVAAVGTEVVPFEYPESFVVHVSAHVKHAFVPLRIVFVVLSIQL